MKNSEDLNLENVSAQEFEPSFNAELLSIPNEAVDPVSLLNHFRDFRHALYDFVLDDDDEDYIAEIVAAIRADLLF